MTDDDEDDLTVAYLWGKAEARDDIRKLQEENERLQAKVDALENAVVEWADAVFLAEGVSFLDGLKCEPLIRGILERPHDALGEDK